MIQIFIFQQAFIGRAFISLSKEVDQILAAVIYRPILLRSLSVSGFGGGGGSGRFLAQHFLYFKPLPHEQGLFLCGFIFLLSKTPVGGPPFLEGLPVES